VLLVGDPAVQELLNVLRAKDPGLEKLLSRHKVQVVVKSATLSEGQRRAYAAALAANLKGLGLDATMNAAPERYEVTAVAIEPVSAHLIDDDADECELHATAAWSAAGLPAIDLNAHGFGDETVPNAPRRTHQRERRAGCQEDAGRAAVSLSSARGQTRRTASRAAEPPSRRAASRQPPAAEPPAAEPPSRQPPSLRT